MDPSRLGGGANISLNKSAKFDQDYAYAQRAQAEEYNANNSRTGPHSDEKGSNEDGVRRGDAQQYDQLVGGVGGEDDAEYYRNLLMQQQLALAEIQRER